MAAEKRCSRCRHAKPLDEFPYGRGSHQRHAYCTLCRADYKAEYEAREDARVRRQVRERARSRAESVMRERHRAEWLEVYEQAWRHEAARANLP